MINPQFIKEYANLTTQDRWRDLQSVFAIINDIGDRLQVIEKIIDNNDTLIKLDQADVQTSVIPKVPFMNA